MDNLSRFSKTYSPSPSEKRMRAFLGTPEPRLQQYLLTDEPAIYAPEVVVRINQLHSMRVDQVIQGDAAYLRTTVLPALNKAMSHTYAVTQKRRVRNPVAAGLRLKDLPVLRDNVYITDRMDGETSEIMLRRSLLVAHANREAFGDIPEDIWAEEDWDINTTMRILGLPSTWSEEFLYAPDTRTFENSNLSLTEQEQVAVLQKNPAYRVDKDLRLNARSIGAVRVVKTMLGAADLACEANYGKVRRKHALYREQTKARPERIGVERAAHTIVGWSAWDPLRLPNMMGAFDHQLAAANVTVSPTGAVPMMMRLYEMMAEYGLNQSYREGAPTCVAEADTIPSLWSSRDRAYQDFLRDFVMDFFDNRTHRGNELVYQRQFLTGNPLISMGDWHAHALILIRGLLSQGVPCPIVPWFDVQTPGLLETAVLWHQRWYVHRILGTVVRNENPTNLAFAAARYFEKVPAVHALNIQYGV